MGHRRLRPTTKSYTLPSSPTHSFSSSSASSDFEFTVSLSPRKSSAADLCPADDLFYKGQLLPLHPSPRLSMVRTLLLSSSSTSSSSDTTTTASRDSTASSDSSSADLLHPDSARPSSATDDELKHLTPHPTTPPKKPSKYFSLPKLFRKDNATAASAAGGGGTVKRVSSGAREVILKYLKKVKPLYEKLSQKQPQQKASRISSSTNTVVAVTLVKDYKSQELLSHQKEEIDAAVTHSFSGNLRLYNRRRSCFSSCPPSMGSSPSHGRNGHGSGSGQMGRPGSGTHNSDTSSMEELQNAIQGAIMHCKNSMLQSKNLVSNEI
ncbi:LOW QUALITY PROTEIN: probable membrane-associated kinase regulator 1 [Salvia miltiorrhiza]|uniref:LOW QUALITY PROTEIN: probable membrane-associated kinase regulator 1 n=1 Tax=Salvia miltiorrhiza TaxID=226208 RepID=UPI0025ACBA72|nr:LOW QUALITY PROTEIN: probable membrane-associated kinase regulator 1 [Salvia miltiorrhiza]